MKRLFAILCVAVALAAAAPAAAREVINRFDADVTVRQDGTLDVTEAISVVAEGNRIRRGIFRDIPLRTLDGRGLWLDNGFRILEIARDGRPEPYRTEWQGRFLRIYIGDEDVFLDHGVHDYTIRYETTRQLRYFDDHDEVYWNVTGNFWVFPILQATATVRLPEGAVGESVAGYTGSFGDTGRDVAVSGEDTSTVRFRATRAFAPQEGMTVAVGFTKGVVAVQADTFFSTLAANAGIALLIAGFLALPAYYLLAWDRVGRDPPSRTVIPLFHPPDNLEPSGLSYAYFKGFRVAGTKDLTLIAALLSLGVKKKLVIEESPGGTITLVRTPDSKGAEEPLPASEAALYEELLAYRDSVTLDKAEGPKLLAAREALRKALSRLYSGKYYRLNLHWFIPGVLVAAAIFFGGLVLQQPPEEGLLWMIPIPMAALFGSIFGAFGYFLWTDPLSGTGNRLLGLLLVVFGVVALLAGVAAIVLLPGLPIYRLAATLLFVGVIMIAAMFFLLGAPTRRGADVLSQIEGFRLYLETAESNRLNMRDAPEMTETLFERYLPYAAALGVEKPWSDAWAAHLRRVAPERTDSFRPYWYRGNNWSSANIGAATAASVAAVSSAMASAMPQPKSSSGSSGGGSSGGGGGGGGGGGW